MKNLSFLLIFVGFALFSNLSFGQSKFDKWPELKTFHGVMSQTFHPSEEGDLKPIKARVGEFLEKAEALRNSTIPAEFNKASVKEAADAMVKEAKDLKSLIEKGGKDEEIAKALNHLHDTFHTIVERCNKNDEEHKSEHK
jgi:cob(I)alamin adenosyltransferase